MWVPGGVRARALFMGGFDAIVGRRLVERGIQVEGRHGQGRGYSQLNHVAQRKKKHIKALLVATISRLSSLVQSQ